MKIAQYKAQNNALVKTLKYLKIIFNYQQPTSVHYTNASPLLSIYIARIAMEEEFTLQYNMSAQCHGEKILRHFGDRLMLEISRKKRFSRKKLYK